MKLFPCHSGEFQVFDFVDENGKSERFARYHFKGGYIWYKFDFFTEDYQTLDDDPKFKFTHQKLEELYAKYRQEMYRQINKNS